MSDAYAEIRTEVEARGWQVVLFPSEGEVPAYAHTVGLSRSHQHPELVVVGLDEGDPDGVMHDLLEAAAELVAGGARFEADTTDDALLEGHRVAFRAIGPRQAGALLEVAREVLGAPVEAVQVVWPDHRGLMPWSPACDERVRAAQPLLWDA